jgi:regulator of sigma E protease
MLTLIVFVLILSVLILIHELGHFTVAKKNNVRVEEFGLGLPPKVWGKKIGETVYSYNLLPFGGFVKLTGEDLNVSEQTENDPRSFASKTAWQRAAILVAGVVMNFMLAVVIYYVFFFANNFRTFNLPLLFDYQFRFGNVSTTNTVITGFQENSPLIEMGVVPGEAVRFVDGAPVNSVQDLRNALRTKAGEPVAVTLEDIRRDDGSVRDLEVVASTNDEGEGILGIFLGRSAVLSYDTASQRVFSGFMHSYNMMAYSLTIFGQLIGISVETGSIDPVSQGVSGPVGIYSVVGNIINFGGDQALLGLLDFIALMSLSLAFLNLMPFPALDGGRLVFVVLELIRGKKIKPSVEMTIHKWGMYILLGLIVLVTIKDIGRFF